MERTWEDMVEEAKAAGGKIHCPNGLPVRCIRADGFMMEIEGGDHPTYMFPVNVEFTGAVTAGYLEDYKMMCGEDSDPTEPQVRDFFTEVHALIYTDGSIALTLYECNYAVFSLRTGFAISGRFVKEKENKLSDESLEKIRSLKCSGA